MKLEQLTLSNYRNYEELNLKFNRGLVIFAGENAQGKTNLLESIYLLSLAKSHRTNKDQDLIRWNQDQASVQALIKTQHYPLPLEIFLSSKGRKLTLNHIEQARRSSFIGKLNAILFAPEDMQLVKGGPALRRKFLDAEISQAHPIYLNALMTYSKVLKQRNQYLKQHGYSDQFDSIYFDILTDQLIESALDVIRYRLNFIKHLETLSQPLHAHLSNQRDSLRLDYKSSSSRLNYEGEDLGSQFKTLFQDETTIKREKALGVTQYGPHRDDLIFYINDKLASDFASQGQQRTLVLSIKLAEIELLNELKGEYPILLLDDVLSELDDHRQHLLMSMIEGRVQTFLTTASIKGIDFTKLQDPDVFLVNNGKVSRSHGMD